MDPHVDKTGGRASPNHRCKGRSLTSNNQRMEMIRLLPCQTCEFTRLQNGEHHLHPWRLTACRSRRSDITGRLLVWPSRERASSAEPLSSRCEEGQASAESIGFDPLRACKSPQANGWKTCWSPSGGKIESTERTLSSKQAGTLTAHMKIRRKKNVSEQGITCKN